MKIAGHPIILKTETFSTNNDAMELGRRGAEDGTVIMALSQTGGRGRLGKTWLSPAGGGLYFSIIMRPALAPAELSKITLAAGVALCRAIESTCLLSPLIKWPNDILIDGKKCGGILTESLFESAAPPLVVLGAGLNISTPTTSFPPDLRNKTTSLQHHSPDKIDGKHLLASILTEVDHVMAQMIAGTWEDILKTWRKHDATLGQRLTWVTAGRKSVTGESLGADDDGLLHVRDDRGIIHEVLSGDIRLLSS